MFDVFTQKSSEINSIYPGQDFFLCMKNKKGSIRKGKHSPILLSLYLNGCHPYVVVVKIGCNSTNHRHLSNIDCLMVQTACLVCFIGTVISCSKKRSLGRPALVTGT